MEQSSVDNTLHPPPRLLLWLVVVGFFLLIVAALAGVSYFTGGQRLATLIPYAGIAAGGVVIAAIGGALIFRKSLPRLMWLWVTLGAVVLLVIGVFASILLYQNVLPPRYQEEMLTQVPFMRVFLPPTPAGGIIPTVAPREGGISPEELLAPSIAATEAVTPEVTEQVAAAIVLAPTETPPPTETPTAIPTTATPALPTVAPEMTTAVQQVADNNSSRPPQARMYGFTWVRQGWNNCGPANITMALSHFGWRENQDYAANLLKPDNEDKNVSPAEMVAFVRAQTFVSAITRSGGDLELIKDFIAANIPVVVETGYYLEGEDWLGHYQTVVGYDDNQNVFYIYDSWLGTGAGDGGITERYDRFDANWQTFNRVFIAIYEPEREAVVQQILNDRADVTQADQRALEVAREEARANRQNGFAWFNLGTSYTKLGEYEQAASAYDQAFQLNLPFRMLWYQFGPFEAYFETGRYDDVLALVNNNLNTAESYVEETFYWQGRVFAAQGRRQEATVAFQTALARNPRYEAARQALETL